MPDPLAAHRQPPPGTSLPPDPHGGPRPVFVVQEHDASSLHWDLRLEVGGTLVSWAVPKGPSTDPREKHLAVRVEDHELSWGTYEGVISEGSYGAGPVIVWDIGPYVNLSTDDDGRLVDPATALADGHLKVWLAGHKLQGAWVLQHARMGGEERNWLLVKVDDAGADARRRPTSTERESVLSGRTVRDLAEQAADDG